MWRDIYVAFTHLLQMSKVFNGMKNRSALDLTCVPLVDIFLAWTFLASNAPLPAPAAVPSGGLCTPRRRGRRLEQGERDERFSAHAENRLGGGTQAQITPLRFASGAGVRRSEANPITFHALRITIQYPSQRAPPE